MKRCVLAAVVLSGFVGCGGGEEETTTAKDSGSTETATTDHALAWAGTYSGAIQLAAICQPSGVSNVDTFNGTIVITRAATNVIRYEILDGCEIEADATASAATFRRRTCPEITLASGRGITDCSDA